ncbi:MobF family relaxase [Thermobifida halotolerans]|nr:MobF family relaxase [Thermobifida halotolerans]
MVTVLGPDAAQVDYRLSPQCGHDHARAADAALTYRLAQQAGARPIERVGAGWQEFGAEAGTVLVDEDDIDQVRTVMAGRSPQTGRWLVKPKLAVVSAAKLPARPLVEAIRAAADVQGVDAAALIDGPQLVKRYGRLERGLRRDGEAHRAPVADLEAVAEAAGIDLEDVYEPQELAAARKHADERVRVGNRGYDVTFDIPKSVSVLWGLADAATAARIEELYLQTVRDSVAALESWTGYVMSGHHGDGRTAQRLDTSGLVGTITLHRTARPVAGQVGDPHLHAHVMIANLARGSDGKWRTIAAGGRDLHRHVAAVGQYARARLRQLLTAEFGVSWERNPDSGRWELSGIDEQVRRLYSRRARQITEEVGECASAEVSRVAARRTAGAKIDLSPEQERAAWRQRAHEAGLSPEALVADVLGRMPPGGAPAVGPSGPPHRPDLDAVAAAVWDPETGVTAQTKVVTRAKVMAAVADALGPGLGGIDELEALTEAVLAHPYAVRLPDAGPSHMAHADRYTSAEVVGAEQTITRSAQARLNAGAAMADRGLAARALHDWQQHKGFTLSTEQTRVVERLVGSGHGVDAVVGVAGAGKTTVMSAARAVWEAAGYRVEGAAVAAVAAAGLRAEAGLSSATLAAWMRRIDDGPGLDGVDVLVIDEAAMVADRDLARLVAEAERTGTKLVGIGDPLQLRSIGVGGAFGRVHELVDGLVLTENRRQRGQVDRAALAAWRDGARRTALALWGEHGMIHAPADADAAHAQMAAAWWADRQRHTDPHDAVEQLLMLAATNSDAAALNAHARALARARGLLTGADVTYRLRGGEHLSLAAGDQVRLRRNDYRSRHSSDPDVLNGYRGVVTAVDARRGALVEWRHNGTVTSAWISPAQIARGDLVHGYAITIAAAQGLTADRCHVYGLGADAHSLYPAMSRARVRTDLYLPACELGSEQVRLRLGEASTAEEALHRVITAYATTLTDTPDSLVLDEIADNRGLTHRTAPTPTPSPLSLEDIRAGRGPAAQAAAEEVAALRQQATELEAALSHLRTQAREAVARAQAGRMRLLLQGTTPDAAREAAEAAQTALSNTLDNLHQTRRHAEALWQQALDADLRDHQDVRQHEQRERELVALEPLALAHDLTRADLARLDKTQLQELRRQHSLQTADLASQPAPRTASRQSSGAPRPAHGVPRSPTSYPLPPPSAVRRPHGPR